MMIAVKKSTGMASWGMQMQNPYFNLVLLLVVAPPQVVSLRRETQKVRRLLSVPTTKTKRDLGNNELYGVLPTNVKYSNLGYCVLAGNHFYCDIPDAAKSHCSMDPCTPAPLPSAELQAYQAFFTATGGASWKACSDSANDPCGCASGQAQISCGHDNLNSHITSM